MQPDATFKSADDLRALYFDQKGVDPTWDTIAYGRIGERSSHTWFVLKYLRGMNNVKKLRRQLDRIRQSDRRAD